MSTAAVSLSYPRISRCGRLYGSFNQQPPQSWYHSRSAWKPRTHVFAKQERDSEEAGSARSVLDAFFLGRAFAEVLNERFGALVEDFLSDVGKREAEIRQSLREFSTEVDRRAEEEKLQSNTQSNAPAGPVDEQESIDATNTNIPPRPDMAVSAEELRAEVALTRATLLAYKEILDNKQSNE
eukprot:jgi/Botrbrau1/5173/Bobra.0172s0044.1